MLTHVFISYISRCLAAEGSAYVYSGYDIQTRALGSPTSPAGNGVGPSVTPNGAVSDIPSAPVVGSETPSTPTRSDIPSSSRSDVPSSTSAAPALLPGSATPNAGSSQPASVPAQPPATPPAQSPVASPAIAPVASPAITPVASPAIAPVESPAIAPVASPATAPVESPADAPAESPAIAPVASPAIAPVAPPATAPVAPPATAPVQSPAAAVTPTVSPLLLEATAYPTFHGYQKKKKPYYPYHGKGKTTKGSKKGGHYFGKGYGGYYGKGRDKKSKSKKSKGKSSSSSSSSYEGVPGGGKGFNGGPLFHHHTSARNEGRRQPNIYYDYDDKGSNTGNGRTQKSHVTTTGAGQRQDPILSVFNRRGQGAP